jgi:VanZ family protein
MPDHVVRLLMGPAAQPLWRLVLTLLMAVVAWLAFSKTSHAGHIPHLDKLQHLLAFGSMACAAALGWPAGLRPALGVLLGLLVYGAFIELVQSQLPYRMASWADLGADAIGIACGLLLIAALRKRWPGG